MSSGEMTTLNVSIPEVWGEFSNRLRKFILKRVQNKHDAEDILQDIFLKIHRSLDTLKNADRLDAWIYEITRHAIIDIL